MVEKAAGAAGQPTASREAAHAVGAQIMGETGRAPDHVANRETPKNGLYMSLRSFEYGGKTIDRGQLFRLSGQINDARLVDLRYCVLVDNNIARYPCRVCGEEFTDLGLLSGHGKVQHEKRRYTPPTPPSREPGESKDGYQNRLDEWAKAAGAAADAADERVAKKEDEIAPLDLTKTAASRE